MSSHNPPSSSTSIHASPTLTPPSRPTRPRLSRGISSRKPAPPPVPPSLRDHPLLDAVTHASSSSSSSGASTSPASMGSSRQSSVAASPSVRPVDKIPLPSPTSLWSVPPRPSPPISGPWSTATPCNAEPVGDAMGLLDTVPAGSTISVASPGGYPWHAMVGSACVPPGTGHNRTPQGYDHVSMPLGAHRPSHRHPQRSEHKPARSPGVGTAGQRHNVGTLHTHSPQPSPPVTPAAA